MKRISIRDLHERTGKLVRDAVKAPLIVTERGQVVAILRTPSALELADKPFPRRRRSSMPKVEVDSTDFISADRD